MADLDPSQLPAGHSEQDRQDLRGIVDVIPQSIIVVDPKEKPFIQTAWRWSTQGCLWTKCEPTIFGIAYFIATT
jgi:hypothetical protein